MECVTTNEKREIATRLLKPFCVSGLEGIVQINVLQVLIIGHYSILSV